MEKKSIKMIIPLLLLCITYAQDFTVEQFNSQRDQINAKAMLTLGGWAIANITAGTALYAGSKEGNRKYFHQMNAAWNVVNLGIAGFGYYGAVNPDTALTLFESIKAQSSIENILLFNAGLDVGYIMTGLYLVEKSINSDKHKNRYKGYGQSLILQGGFLMFFDATVYFLQTQNFETAAKLLSSLSIGTSGIGLTLHF